MKMDRITETASIESCTFSQFFSGAIAWVLLIILDGFVLMTLWLWFVVPLGPPAITIGHALGLSLMLALATANTQRIKRKINVEFWVERYVVRLAALLLGWIFAGFV